MGKRQPKPEPFSLEELEEIAQSPALQGFEKVLQYRPILVDPLHPLGEKLSSTVEDALSSTVEATLSSTVDDELSTTVEDDRSGTGPRILWIAQGAEGVFTSTRIKRIERAQDALTHVEEAAYDALWGPKKKDPEPYRLTQMGYAELAKRARVSKRSIQSVIDRLLEKEFIQVETPPDISRRQSTVYRVFGYAAVLKHMRDRGWQYVVRTGKGVFYASQLITPNRGPTVEDGISSTVEARSTSTVEPASTVTVEARSTSTVEATSTLTSLGNSEGNSSSSSGKSANAIAAAIVRLLPIDDDAVSRLVASCRRNDPAASDDEISYCAEMWIRENARNVSIRKPVAVMLTAVPKFFEAPATELHRYRKQKADEAEQSRQAATAILSDPESTDCERQWALSVLGQP